jgi:hypothetical protein
MAYMEDVGGEWRDREMDLRISVVGTGFHRVTENAFFCRDLGERWGWALTVPGPSTL